MHGIYHISGKFTIKIAGFNIHSIFMFNTSKLLALIGNKFFIILELYARNHSKCSVWAEAVHVWQPLHWFKEKSFRWAHEPAEIKADVDFIT